MILKVILLFVGNGFFFILKYIKCKFVIKEKRKIVMYCFIVNKNFLVLVKDMFRFIWVGYRW